MDDPRLDPIPPNVRMTEIRQPILARGKARYVGEPVAMVVAEDRYLAQDALDLIRVKYEPLPSVVELADALKDEVILHDDPGTNVVLAHRREVWRCGGGVQGSRSGDKEELQCEPSLCRTYGNPGSAGVVRQGNRRPDRMECHSVTTYPQRRVGRCPQERPFDHTGDSPRLWGVASDKRRACALTWR